MGFSLAADPAAIFLHLTPMSRKNITRKALLLQLLNAAKAFIPSVLKSSSPSTVGQQFAKVNDIQEMEDLTAVLRDKTPEITRNGFTGMTLSTLPETIDGCEYLITFCQDNNPFTSVSFVSEL